MENAAPAGNPPIAAPALLSYTPLAHLFGFVPLPAEFLLVLGGIMVFYVVAAETAKTIFYRKIGI